MPGTGGGGAFFFFRLKDIPSVDEASDDVEPLKLWPGEFWFDNDLGVGSGVIECLQYLYFNMTKLQFFGECRTATNETMADGSHESIARFKQRFKDTEKVNKQEPKTKWNERVKEKTRKIHVCVCKWWQSQKVKKNQAIVTT